MRRFGLPLLLTLLVTTASIADDKPDEKKKPDEDAGKLVIRWHGQSFFEITTPKGVKIICDPHGLEQYRMSLKEKEETIPADIVLISHPHSDHNYLANIKSFKDKDKVKQYWGVDPMTRDWNKIHETHKGVKIELVPTYHDKIGGMDKGKNGVFVIDIDGIRVVHLGDLGHVLTDKQVMRILGQASADDPPKPVDVLLIPVGGVYTLNGLDAMKVVDQLKPTRHTIPMHYGTLVYDWLLDLKKTHFLDDVPKDRIVDLNVTAKTDKNKLVIDPKAPAPKEMKFTILHFFDN